MDEKFKSLIGFAIEVVVIGFIYCLIVTRGFKKEFDTSLIIPFLMGVIIYKIVKAIFRYILLPLMKKPQDATDTNTIE